MVLTRVLILAALAAAIPVWAFQQTPSTRDGTAVALADAIGVTAINPIIATNGLTPRQPHAKEAFVVKPAGESQMVIKFRDEVKARPRPDKRVQMLSAETAAVDEIAAQHQLEFAPISKTHTQADLETLQARAEAYSRRAQPDLGGMMSITGPENELQAAANALLKLDSVEYVNFIGKMQPAGPPLLGACCVGNQPCVELTQAECEGMLGQWFDTPCTPGFCLIGACCFKGVCFEDVTQGECLSTGVGAQFASGLTCATANFDPPCEPPITGACCLQDDKDTCDPNADTQAECAFAGGVFIPNVTCGELDCATAIGACCYYPDVCVETTIDECFEPSLPGFTAGVFRGGKCDGGVCDFACGDDDLAGCFTVHGYPYCNNTDCCELVGAFRDFCVNPDPPVFGFWDELCVTLANFLCGPPGPPGLPGTYADRCNTTLNGSCFVEHVPGGCWQASPKGPPTNCCEDVCTLDPSCCSGNWDALCVSLAYDLCSFQEDEDKVTPDLTAYQGYLRASPYEDEGGGAPFGQLGGRPTNFILPPLPPDYFSGYAGEGLNLFSEGPNPDDPDRLTDSPDMPEDQLYEGLYGLGRALHEVYGVGDENMARGASIKVGVIEWAYYGPEPFTDENENGEYDDGEPFIDHNGDMERSLGHEDLDVIPEPGQTMIMIPSISQPDHGTACLGIINAKENPVPVKEDFVGELDLVEVGMVGIAPDAQAYFFPITSVEEGPRLSAAFFSCYLEFSPGDVVSCSFVPQGGGRNLNCSGVQAIWDLIRLGTDLGIQVVVSAGDGCINLSDLAGPDFGDSGAIVVGACTPGLPFCRLTSSNYDRAAPLTSDRRVHCSGWGQFVASLGYGDLFYGDGNVNRSYTKDFFGSSAAAPQVAGVIACLQGLSKQFFGVPLSTAMNPAITNNIRSLLVNTGFPQCGGGLIGFDPEAPCGPDIVPDQPVNHIGPFPRPRIAGDDLLTYWNLGFDNSPLMHNLYILRGNHIIGNIFSTKASDNNYVLLQSLYTNRNFIPTLTSASPEANQLASRVKYLATAFTGDLMVQGRSTTPAPTLNIRAEIQSDFPALLFVEMYDWLINRWSFVAFASLPAAFPGDEVPFISPSPFNAPRFINRRTGNFYIRCYVIVVAGQDNSSVGIGDTQPGVGPFIRVDHIDVRPGVNIGVPPV